MKVELVDHMGTDLSVVNAARVSFDKFHEVFEEGKDDRLIGFLARENHWSPFSHTSVSLRIQAPIFVARQLGKHQVGLSWNEVSRRYVDAQPEFYYPEDWRKKASDKKQGSSSEVVSLIGACVNGEDSQTHPSNLVEYLTIEMTLLYKHLLDAGVCPEQARMVLPQSMYTTWIWTGSLYAYARVCNLRLKPDTQAETRLVAGMIADHCKTLFPVSWKVLVEDNHG